MWGSSLVGRGRSRLSWGVGLKNNDSQPSHRVGNSAVCRERGRAARGQGPLLEHNGTEFIKHLSNI